MSNALQRKIADSRLPQLAAIVVFFLGVSAQTPLDATPVTASRDALPFEAGKETDKKNTTSLIRLLSDHDADMYHAVFVSQDKQDWTSADAALAQIKDKRLLGHVLADRYQHRGVSLVEAKKWMDAYADYPEAMDIYANVANLPGFAAAHIARPVTVSGWSGNNGGGTFTAFHTVGLAKPPSTLASTHIDGKINTALRHNDPMAAREILDTEMHRGTVTGQQASDDLAHIAAAFFYQGEFERARTPAHMAAEAGSPLGQWIDGLSSWKQQNFVAASRSFASLAQQPGVSQWDHAAASYWAYRAAKRNNDNVQAHHWLFEASKNPDSFYGALAANLTSAPLARSWKMPEMNSKVVDVLALRPEGWRALALIQVGKADLAEGELRRINPTGARTLQNQILAVAEYGHMPALTYQLGGIATNDNGQRYEAAQYPLPPWQPASGFKVDRALIYALVKHESQFDPDAVSDRGACGLMQIMPSTARQISNDNNPGKECPDALFDPATNLELGQKYVRVLAGQPMIGDNLLLLLAAYNGGPGNLSRWLDGDDRADPLMFIESMPLHETRDYVQQVLLQYWMYRSRLSEPETSMAQLARGEWPRYALNENKTEVVASR